jgi:hypothetical protein
MDAKTYLQTRSREEVERLCAAADTSLGYFQQLATGNRKPSSRLAKLLVENSNGELDLESLLFPPKREAA